MNAQAFKSSVAAASLLSLALVSGCGVTAKAHREPGKVYSAHNGPVCLLAGAPPSGTKYEAVGRIVATKRSYGSVDELFPAMARQARSLGAEAIINLQSDQRFKGPLPWRVTSPTGDGVAIKLQAESPKLDCMTAGGKLY